MLELFHLYKKNQLAQSEFLYLIEENLLHEQIFWFGVISLQVIQVNLKLADETAHYLQWLLTYYSNVHY